MRWLQWKNVREVAGNWKSEMPRTWKINHCALRCYLFFTSKMILPWILLLVCVGNYSYNLLFITLPNLFVFRMYTQIYFVHWKAVKWRSEESVFALVAFYFVTPSLKLTSLLIRSGIKSVRRTLPWIDWAC